MEKLLELFENEEVPKGSMPFSEVIQEAARRQISPLSAGLGSADLADARFLQALADCMGLPWCEADVPMIDAPLRQQFPATVALQHQIYPFRNKAGKLCVLTCDPFNLFTRQIVSRLVSEPIVWCMATRQMLLGAIRSGYGIGADTFEALMAGRLDLEPPLDSKQEVSRLDDENLDASIVGFVNQIIREALAERATDIHLEPLDDDLRIRYRIDGILHEVPVPPRIKDVQDGVISRIKIMAHLDIAERRMPQDGRINLEMEGRPIDVRVATIPTLEGESVSLRLLARLKFDFSVLNLSPRLEKTVQNQILQPNGIIILTGPTGCGKSTTLYTFLSKLNTVDRRIVTIEDPVEHKLSGVMQISIKPEINLTFATALRSVLRGDPNVIMVGEMRDFETAEIAIRAALTGHLVFSTLHTNDAIGGITRLIDMGVQPFLVSSSVRAFLAQRLVRVLCPTCKKPAANPESYVEEFGVPAEFADKIQQPMGCPLCRQTGYRGRLALFELCTVTNSLQEMITQGASPEVMYGQAIKDGMVSLREDGWQRVAAGLTSVEEVIRVTSSDLNLLDE